MSTRALVLAMGLGAFLLAGPARAATDPTDKCVDAKAKTAGKKAQDILKALGKNIAKNPDTKLGANISKAQSKFTKGFTKAESKGACFTNGDAAAIEAKVDALSFDVVEQFGPSCGNGIKGPGEECDGGNGDGSGSSADCLSGTCNAGCECADCGDGIVLPPEDCDDGAANGTSASCCASDCTFQPAATSCDDGAFCNGTETCDGAGTCGSSTGDPCPGTECNTCQEASDSCFDPNGTACTDDGNVCTNDECDGAGTCAHPNNTDPCDDGLFCTQTDTCAGGTCVGSGDPCSGGGECADLCDEGADNCFDPAATPCTDDGNVCTDDECDGAGACTHPNNTNPCDDGLFCTQTDTCSGGSCVGSGDPCPGTECNTCQEATDTCFDPAGTSCTDDGAFCNGPEECDGAGSCAGTGDPCSGGGDCNSTCNEGPDNCFDPASTPCSDTDGEPCTTAGCDGAGACDQGHVTDPDGTPCGPGSACNSEECLSGVCTNQSACCSPSFDGLIRFETDLETGVAGTLSKFACSNSNDVACVTNGDCDLGVCVTIISGCSGNTSVSCTVDGDCVGTCGEVTTAALPQDLDLGGLYTGGGLNSVPLPLPIPDQGLSFTNVDSCNPSTGELTMGPTTQADVTGRTGVTVAARHCTTGRTCSVTTSQNCILDSDCPSTETCETNCLFGPQLPIPNPGTPATSVCTVNNVAGDASGTTQCDGGDTALTLPLRSVVFLTGDLLSSSVGPVNVAGVQPCSLCVRQCDDASSNDGAPCADDTDCTGGSCLAQTRCLGGPDGAEGGDGAGGSDPANNTSCTPETSGAAILGSAFPTSHDCGLDSGQDITANIGGLPVDFALTSGSITSNATDQPQQLRTFAGFCRDVNNGASLAFEGDPAGDPCVNCQSGVAVPCDSDADCQTDTDTYESCAQRNPGAFSRAAATRIELQGATDGGCLGDGLGHQATLVSQFDISPTFDSTVDAAGDLPGPGAALITGDATLE